MTRSKNLSRLFFGTAAFIAVVLVFVSLSISAISLVSAASDSDAIAIRIIPNPNRYTAREWYDLQGFSGSPQSIMVDGYDAIRDGRTVYVSAANINTVSNQIQSNIYLISYNQTSDPSTIDIFGKLLSHWKFNNNINISGACNISTLNCSATSDCPVKYECLSNRCQLTTANTIGCLGDTECPVGLFCSSQKAKIIRDIRRSNSLSLLRNSIEAYHQGRGIYPNLSAGTYLSGAALSVWPSWNEFLSTLGSSALVDPINKIGVCSGYDKDTCWNAQTKSFYGNSSAANLILPAGSSIISYTSNLAGSSYNICASMETNYSYNKGESFSSVACKAELATGSGLASTTPNRAPVFVDPASSSFTGESGTQFSGFVKAVDPDGDLLRISIAAGAPCGLSLGVTSDPNQYKLSGTPSFVGDCFFDLSASDVRGSSTPKTFKLTTSNVPPKITAENVTYTLGTGKLFDYNVYFEDTNLADALGNIKAYSLIIKSPNTVSFSNKNLSITKLADSKYQMNIKFGVLGMVTKDMDMLLNVSVTDQSNVVANTDFTVHLLANPPKLNFNCPVRLNVDDVFRCQVKNENTSLDNVIYTVEPPIPANSGIEFNTATALVSGVPRIGSYKLKIKAVNSNGASDSADYNFDIVEETCGKIMIKLDGGPWNQDGTVQNGAGYYKTMVVGDQCWFKNELRDSKDWKKPLVKSAYNYTPNFIGDCPAGFHIPTDPEWYKLESYLNNTSACLGDRVGDGCKDAGLKIANQFSLLLFSDNTSANPERFWSSSMNPSNSNQMWVRSFVRGGTGLINRSAFTRSTAGPSQLCVRNTGWTYCGDGTWQDQNIKKDGGPNGDGKESCDNTDLNNKNCTNLKVVDNKDFYFTRGNLSCDSVCRFYTGDCICDQVWGPSPASKCGIFTQSDNCGLTREISGTKDCNDNDPCTVDSCVNNECKNTFAAIGTSCGLCMVCNGNGTCMGNKQPNPVYAANACVCDPTDSCCSSNGLSFKPVTTLCRAAAGLCDKAETCTGSSGLCPTDVYQTTSQICRAAVGACDQAENCTGLTINCPTDIKKTAGTECRASAGDCDISEKCSGNSDACPADVFENSTTVCRNTADLCDTSESCTGSSASCPSDHFAPANTACRASFDVCDKADTCTGDSKVCPDSVQSAGYSCRPAIGNCDNAETCDGSSKSCPIDAYKALNTLCRASTGVCDPQEVCTGNTGVCPSNIISSASTVCRASAGLCDVSETCNGTAGTCPTNSFLSAGITCRPAAGDCDAPETCSGSSDACPNNLYYPSTYNLGICNKCTGSSPVSVACTCNPADPCCSADGLSFKPATTSCRASAGPCDKAEFCTGSSGLCPGDSFQPSSQVCRAAAGVCDQAENCTGGTAACPSDAKKPSSSVCRASAGICDPAETCNGSINDCPVDTLSSSATVCRAATDICDVTENCTGSSATCPGDSMKSAGTTCRSALDVCDKTEVCSGSSKSCPGDSFQSAGYTCRAAAGDCDIAETCTGLTAFCPGDAKKTSATVCRASAGTCDPAETCDGSIDSCPGNSLANSSTVCRAATDLCDQAENCTGSSAACPTDYVKSAGAVCRTVSVGSCDKEDTCNGTAKTCPDLVQPSGYVCRPSVGDCDSAEACNGASKSCPLDVYKTANTLCRASSGVCDPQEVCTGNTGVCPSNIVSSGNVCRASAGACDVSESCDGVNGACPSDHFSAGITCRSAVGDCDVAEICNGASAACPADTYRPSSFYPGICRTCTGFTPTSVYQSSGQDLFGNCDVLPIGFCSGYCGGGGKCIYNACPCTPITKFEACTEAGILCGAEPDGCGGYYVCGTCISPRVCDGIRCVLDITCFLSGTKITMSDGLLKDIEDIEIGDYVKTYDIINNKIISNKVTKIFHHTAEESNGYLVINGFLKVTPVHRILLNNYWQEIGNAKIGDTLKTETGQVIITSIEKFDDQVPTYNFEVENTHTYYADGILVHNIKSREVLP